MSPNRAPIRPPSGCPSPNQAAIMPPISLAPGRLLPSGRSLVSPQAACPPIGPQYVPHPLEGKREIKGQRRERGPRRERVDGKKRRRITGSRARGLCKASRPCGLPEKEDEMTKDVARSQSLRPPPGRFQFLNRKRPSIRRLRQASTAGAS